MAIAMIDHTVDSRPLEIPERIVVAGPVRVDAAISCTGCVSVDVKYSVRRLTDLREHEADHDREEHPPPLAERTPALVVVVADVEDGDETGADDGEHRCGEEAAVDRRHRALVVVGGAHREDADDRREHADGAGNEREDEAERRVGTDRVERGDAEDDRSDERDLVALEQVGGHPGAVADVVAHVVGDGRRVAGVVLGDALLDLADEVGADVGGLGEDPATDSHEQRDQRSAEAEADEDRGGRVLEEHDDHGRAEQAEPDRVHAGDAAGAERDLERGLERAGARGRRGAHVAAHREAHADEPGEPGEERAGDEGRCPRGARTGRTSGHCCRPRT